VTSSSGFGVAADDTAVGIKARQKKIPATMNRPAFLTSPKTTIIWPATSEAYETII